LDKEHVPQYTPAAEEAVQYVPVPVSNHSQEEEEKGNLSQDSLTNELNILEQVSNPVLFTEFLMVIGRVPMSKLYPYQVTPIVVFFYSVFPSQHRGVTCVEAED